MPATGIIIITYTLKYIPKAFAFPKTTTEDCLQRAIEDIIAIMKDPPKTLPYLSYFMQKKCNQLYFPHFVNNHRSAPHI